jgi:hypothetical protein
MTDKRSVVNIKITRTAPGFVAGKTGKTVYGTDPANPWGYIRHAFWPRCVAEGTITTPEGAIDFKGQAFYSFAMQAMKPHHAAGKWSFANFQGPEYSAIMMQFTTPPSYGTTTVSVGGIAKDGEIVVAGVNNSATHTKTKPDADNQWPEPEEIKFTWSGSTKDGKAVEAVIEGPLGPRLDRVDVLAEVPGFVKQIVAGAAGTKPYIYQVRAHFVHAPTPAGGTIRGMTTADSFPFSRSTRPRRRGWPSSSRLVTRRSHSRASFSARRPSSSTSSSRCITVHIPRRGGLPLFRLLVLLFGVLVCHRIGVYQEGFP